MRRPYVALLRDTGYTAVRPYRRTAFRHPVGCTLAFSRKRFFGSYLFLMATSRG